MPTRSSKILRVMVVAESPETLDGLHGYLSSAGVTSHTSRTLCVAAAVPPAVSAVVLFPDEFAYKAVVASIQALRAARPKLLLLVITSMPQRYQPALDPDGRSRLPVVLQRPAFGWTILDTIRGQANRESV